MPRRRRPPLGCLVAAAICVALAAGAATGCSESAAPWTPPSRRIPHEPADALTGFAPPIRVRLPTSLVPAERHDRMVGWTVTGSGGDGIRVMAPVAVRTGTARRPAPADYHAYLVGLSAVGVRVLGDRPVRVGGLIAHRTVLAPSRAVESGFGCWTTAAGDCLSLAPGTRLDVVTLTVRGEPLVLWSRTWHARADRRTDAALERLIATLAFPDRVQDLWSPSP